MRSKYFRAMLIAHLLSSSTPSLAKFEAHEWGTFTSLVGSDGKTQPGMYHEDEKLPDFVHGFGDTLAASPMQAMGSIGNPSGQPPFTTTTTMAPYPRPCRGKSCFEYSFLDSNPITQKMETPVIYFYSDQQKRVAVDVQFPEGLITEAYPAPVFTFPDRSTLESVGNGRSRFEVNVLAAKTAELPKVESGNIYSHAREVNSNIVSVPNGSKVETEKFIFYRGLGRFQPLIDISSMEGSIHIRSTPKNLPLGMFLLNVSAEGETRGFSLGKNLVTTVSRFDVRRLKGELPPSKTRMLLGPNELKAAMIDALVESGLFRDEAEAMLNTWENGYLKTSGLRLLYILPRDEVDQILPVAISPKPENFNRAFVARIEILLDTEETQILKDIKLLGNKFEVTKLGRFAEATLRRIQQMHNQSSSFTPETARVISELIRRAAFEEASPSSAIH